MKNQVQLIAYADRFSGGDLKTLGRLLHGPLKGLFGGIHILPFFYPIDGADTGFDPVDHTRVDDRLGNWSDIKALSGSVEIIADLIVNHVSTQSPQFMDFLAKGDNSAYAGMFLTLEKVFPDGVTEKELLRIYRPRPNLPFTVVTLRDGSKKIVWTSFTSKQVDIDVHDPQSEDYLTSILQTFADNGIKMVRLDAVGYAIKTANSNCFMTPDTFEFIEQLANQAKQLGMDVLVEIHSYYKKQIEIAKKVDWVYDFALPPLVLDCLFNRSARNLKKWLNISPRNVVTVLDTHDGIGIIDVGPGTLNLRDKGLLNEDEINYLVETIHANSGGISRKASGEGVRNLDLYQVNCTYYDALGRDDNVYLLARLIQFFSPGIPEVYYMGLLAARNDVNLFAKTGSGRDINRRFYTYEQVEKDLKKPVVQSLIRLIRFRNSHPAFNGEFHLMDSADDILHIFWLAGKDKAEALIDLKEFTFQLFHTGVTGENTVSSFTELPDLQ